ncbi:LysR family transcriptional regulator [Acidicapsa dinghuensis]|uniref:LysR family transcriptional regulator n=1 Tax=Acidicapsa dinghuensis TaxID=2218256 RepID=A0ABW1ENZ5_9BACT
MADEGSFSRAADRLDLRQSHVSRTIKMLEEQLGFQIFLRKQWTTISPTPAGTLLVEYARDAIKEHDETILQIRECEQ